MVLLSSGCNFLYIISRVETHFATVKLPFAPALLILFPQFQQLLTCKKKEKENKSSLLDAWNILKYVTWMKIPWTCSCSSLNENLMIMF